MAHAEASGFVPEACKDPVTSDFDLLSNYLFSEVEKGGFKGAAISAGAGSCSFGTNPTTLSVTYMFVGTPKAAEGLEISPIAPFKGTNITAPIVVKQVMNVRFHFHINPLTDATHKFDDVWVHDGLGFDDELAFMNGICSTKTAFDTAIATSPQKTEVTTWLATENGYYLAYDATVSFNDGTTVEIPDANRAASGPYFAPCSTFK